MSNKKTKKNKKKMKAGMTPLQMKKKFVDAAFNTDYNVLEDSLVLPDQDARAHSFMQAFHDAVNTDEEPWHETGSNVMDALLFGNTEYLMAMICGWGAKSLAKQAMLIRDEDYQFHDQALDAKMVVYWDNDQTSTCECLVDVATLGVWGYHPQVMKNCWGDDTKIEHIAVAVTPIEDGITYEFYCFSKDELEKNPNKAAYWYTPDPEVEPSAYVN